MMRSSFFYLAEVVGAGRGPSGGGNLVDVPPGRHRDDQHVHAGGPELPHVPRLVLVRRIPAPTHRLAVEERAVGRPFAEPAPRAREAGVGCGGHPGERRRAHGPVPVHHQPNREFAVGQIPGGRPPHERLARCRESLRLFPAQPHAPEDTALLPGFEVYGRPGAQAVRPSANRVSVRGASVGGTCRLAARTPAASG